MSPVDARMLQLLADLRRDWQQVVAHTARAKSVDPRHGDPEAALVALSMDHAYQAFEAMLIRLERALSLPERSGSSWHAALLFDAGREMPGLRSAVFPIAATTEWEALLKFRHFLRHAYAVALDPERLAKNRNRLQSAVDSTAPYVEALLAALERAP